MTSTVRPSGEQFEIGRGAQRAVVTEVGATLRAYDVDGRPLVDGFEADEMAHGARGQVLAPWPNRIAAGRYRFGDADHQLPINEVSTGCAIHGLVRWLAWHLVDRSAEAVRLATILPPQPGYPFTISFECSYRLEADGLQVNLLARNLGASAAPFGAGFHPYLAAPAGQVDSAELELVADEYLEADERLIPTGRRLPVAGSPFDFRRSRAVAGAVLDVCFPAPERREARFAGRTLWWDAAFAFVQVFSGDTLAPSERRRGLALEPMTCPGNAFNSGEGLLVLEPGEEWSGTWGIRP